MARCTSRPDHPAHVARSMRPALSSTRSSSRCNTSHPSPRARLHLRPEGASGGTEGSAGRRTRRAGYSPVPPPGGRPPPAVDARDGVQRLALVQRHRVRLVRVGHVQQVVGPWAAPPAPAAVPTSSSGRPSARRRRRPPPPGARPAPGEGRLPRGRGAHQGQHPRRVRFTHQVKRRPARPAGLMPPLPRPHPARPAPARDPGTRSGAAGRRENTLFQHLQTLQRNRTNKRHRAGEFVVEGVRAISQAWPTAGRSRP